MIKKFICYLWEKKFLQYTIVGSSAFVIDFVLLIFFREFLGMNPTWALALEQILVVAYIFFLNKYWSFKAKGQTVKQITRFFILMLWNYVFAIAWMWFFTNLISFSFNITLFGKVHDIWYLFVRLANILLAISWNFLIYKYWVYKNEKAEVYPVVQ